MVKLFVFWGHLCTWDLVNVAFGFLSLPHSSFMWFVTQGDEDICLPDVMFFYRDCCGDEPCLQVPSPLAPSLTSGVHRSHLMRTTAPSRVRAKPSSKNGPLSPAIACCACHDDLQALLQGACKSSACDWLQGWWTLNRTRMFCLGRCHRMPSSFLHNKFTRILLDQM